MLQKPCFFCWVVRTRTYSDCFSLWTSTFLGETRGANEQNVQDLLGVSEASRVASQVGDTPSFTMGNPPLLLAGIYCCVSGTQPNDRRWRLSVAQTPFYVLFPREEAVFCFPLPRGVRCWTYTLNQNVFFCSPLGTYFFLEMFISSIGAERYRRRVNT